MNKTPGKVFEGDLNAKGLRFGIVCARFNEFFVGKLLDGAMDAFVRHGGDPEQVDVAWVPGSYELPYAVSRMLARGEYDAVIALGTVIRGGTAHFEYVAGGASNGLAHVAQDSEIPVAFGVLTTESIEQAIERAGTKAGNKGAEAALTALEMINVLKAIKA